MNRRLVVGLAFILAAGSVFAFDLESVFGTYKVILHEKTGTFSLYAGGSNGKYKPILSTIDNSAGTQFFLKTGNDVYSLNPRAGVSVNQLLRDTNAIIEYTVKGKAFVSFVMSFVSSVSGGDPDLIKCTVTVKNTAVTAQVFALKAVFDTALGELTPCHFSTASRVALNEEYQFLSMENDRWIRSADATTAMQLLLFGSDISVPRTVTVANRDILLTGAWDPPASNGRGFNSLYSYNNSAVAVHWDQEKLAPQSTMTICFYISVATDGALPADTDSQYFTGLLPAAAPVLPETFFYDEFEPEPVAVPETETVPEPLPPVVPVAPAVPEVYEEPPAESDADSDYADYSEYEDYSDSEPIAVTKEQMDETYIANLLERIRLLENDPDAVDREEVRRLNAELDAILEKVRQN